MSKLKMKAKAGFTLVELLVVMLIIAILTVAMLPMFKEYICKAQYSAEALPVIGNLRTKIGLYYYDHGKLPGNVGENKVASWEFNKDDREAYVPATYELTSAPTGHDYAPEDGELAGKMIKSGKDELTAATDKKKHFGDTTVIDIGADDLKGRRSLPIDYVYYNIPCLDTEGKPSKTDTAYVVGCFGAGEGLAARTGYAVCEINNVAKGKKYVGIFERYKAKALAEGEEEGVPYLYLNNENKADSDVSGLFVYCPDKIESGMMDPDDTFRPSIVTRMEQNGWKFSD